MEIERKFLVKNDRWKKDIISPTEITQFYLTERDHFPSVRLRIQKSGHSFSRGFITLKHESISEEILARNEFECEIPIAKIKEQIPQATGGIIEKTRYLVKGVEGKIWEVDVFKNPDNIPTIAEIELESIEDSILLPSWIGEEVTLDSRFGNLEISFDNCGDKMVSLLKI